MTTINDLARFTIDADPSSDAGGDRLYIATNSQTLDITLETNPSPVQAVTYAVYDSSDTESPLASYGAATITWNENSQASITPTGVNDTVTIDMPASGVVSYLIRATVQTINGEGVFERLVAVATSTTPPLRKTVPAESTQARARAWSDDLNEMVDAINAGGGSGGSAQSYTFIMDPGGTPSSTVYNDMETATAAANALDGVVTIIMMNDDSPSGAVDFSNVRLESGMTDDTPHLFLPNATITGTPPLSINNVRITMSSGGVAWTITSDFSMSIEFSDRRNGFNTIVGGSSDTSKLFDVQGGADLYITAKGVDFDNYVFDVDSSSDIYIYADNCTLDFPLDGDSDNYHIYMSNDSVVAASATTDHQFYPVGQYYQLDVDSNQELFGNYLASVDASAGSFIVGLPQSNECYPGGKFIVVVDQDNEARTNPIEVEGDLSGARINDLSQYYLNKAGDGIILVPRGYGVGSSYGYAGFTVWPRFFNELVFKDSGTPTFNEFQTSLANLREVADGFPGIKRIRITNGGPSTSAESFDWSDYYVAIESGVTSTWLAPAALTGLPRMFWDSGVINTTDTIYTEALSGDTVKHEPLFYMTTARYNGGGSSATFDFTAAAPASKTLTVEGATLEGSATAGLFGVDANTTLHMHVKGLCSIEDQTFDGAGDVNLIVYDPRSTIALTQTHLSGTYTITYAGLSPIQFGNGDIGALADVRLLTPGWESGAAVASGGTPRRVYPGRVGFIAGFSGFHAIGAGDGDDVEYQVFVNGSSIGTAATVASNSTTAFHVRYAPVKIAPTDYVEVRATKAADITDGALDVFVWVDFIAG